MINFKRLDHIQICIPKGKENEARYFYTDIIGLTEIPKPDSLIANGGVWYKIADIQLQIRKDIPLSKCQTWKMREAI